MCVVYDLILYCFWCGHCAKQIDNDDDDYVTQCKLAVWSILYTVLYSRRWHIVSAIAKINILAAIYSKLFTLKKLKTWRRAVAKWLNGLMTLTSELNMILSISSGFVDENEKCGRFQYAASFPAYIAATNSDIINTLRWFVLSLDLFSLKFTVCDAEKLLQIESSAMKWHCYSNIWSRFHR